MAVKQEDLLSKPLYVYGLPGEVLESLTLKENDGSSTAVPSETSAPSTNISTPTNETSVGSQSCSLCSLSFNTYEDHRSHIKSDLHHYNLKLKLRGQTPVTEAEFEALLEKLDESLSGSESEDTDDSEDEQPNEAKSTSTLTALLKKQARIAADEQGDDTDSHDDGPSTRRRNRGKPPLIWFSSPLLPPNHHFGLYRAILTSQDLRSPSTLSVLRSKQLEPIKPPTVNKDGTPSPHQPYTGPHIFLCMIGGGHFAAMVVSLAPRHQRGGTTMNREATVLAHKTFHRYTTRRKQGGSQGLNDNAKGNAHSVGSSLRRHNEEALRKDTRALLADWKGLIDTSELLFVRATGSANRATLFGPYEGQVLRHNDQRIRGFPFSTRRATQNELMRSFIELTRFKVRELVPQVDESDHVKAATSKPTPKPSKPSKPKLTDEEETALLHTSQLQAFIRRSKVPALLSYLTNNNLSPDFEFTPPEQNHHAPRPLHLAASSNSAPLVLGLLVRGGADPSLLNGEGKTAFELAGDRPTRDAFRVARSELGEAATGVDDTNNSTPDRTWTWEASQVPPAMTRGEADARNERDKKEAEAKEAERRSVEEAKLRNKTTEAAAAVSGGKRGKSLAEATALTPQEQRQQETRGLTPEMRAKLERERRARAAEARMRAMATGR